MKPEVKEALTPQPLENLGELPEGVQAILASQLLAKEQAPQVKRDPKTGRVLPGQVLNPKGRHDAARAAVIEAARKECLNSLRVLVELRDHSKSEKIRLMAAEALLDRGIGTPFQAKYPEEYQELKAISQEDLDSLLD